MASAWSQERRRCQSYQKMERHRKESASHPFIVMLSQSECSRRAGADQDDHRASYRFGSQPRVQRPWKAVEVSQEIIEATCRAGLWTRAGHPKWSNVVGKGRKTTFTINKAAKKGRGSDLVHCTQHLDGSSAVKVPERRFEPVRLMEKEAGNKRRPEKKGLCHFESSAPQRHIFSRDG